VHADQRGALTRRILLVALLVPALAPALGGLLVQWLSWRGVLWACRRPWWRSGWCWPGCRPMARAVPRLQAYALSTAMLALGALLLALTWLGEPGHRAAGAVLLLIAMLLAAVHLRHGGSRRSPCCAGRCCPIGPAPGDAGLSGSARCVHRQSAGQYPAAAPGRLARHASAR
jgi:hypothetical protein